MGNMISHGEKVSRTTFTYISTSFHLFKDLFFGFKARNASVDVAGDLLGLSKFLSYSPKTGKRLKDKSICSRLGQIVNELIKISV